MRPRIHYTESQKALMWERWQKGESLQQIAQLFDRNHSSIKGILAATWTVGAIVVGNFGGRHSDFGSLPQAASLLVKVARYF